jgi:hypothetical protein
LEPSLLDGIKDELEYYLEVKYLLSLYSDSYCSASRAMMQILALKLMTTIFMRSFNWKLSPWVVDQDMFQGQKEMMMMTKRKMVILLWKSSHQPRH